MEEVGSQCAVVMVEGCYPLCRPFFLRSVDLPSSGSSGLEQRVRLMHHEAVRPFLDQTQSQWLLDRQEGLVEHDVVLIL